MDSMKLTEHAGGRGAAKMLDCWILLVRLEPRICRTVEVSWVPFTNSWFLRASSSCVKTHVEPSFNVKSSPPRSSCNLYTNDSETSLFVDLKMWTTAWSVPWQLLALEVCKIHRRGRHSDLWSCWGQRWTSGLTTEDKRQTMLLQWKQTNKTHIT